MKIAMVILHADRMRGGAERHTIELADRLIDRGHQVHLLATSFDDGVLADRHLIDARGVTRTGRYVRFLAGVDEAIARIGPDVVHSILPVRGCDVYQPQSGYETINLREEPLARTGAARIVKRFTNALNLKRRRFAAIERDMIRSGRSINLCRSERMRELASSTFDVDRSRFETHYNAVDLSRFVWRDARDTDRPTFLIVAQDFVRKGVDRCIVALSRMSNRHAKLVIVGSPDPSACRLLATRIGVEDRVTFAGPQRDVRPFFADADAFVLPTSHDPCSIVVIEALASGLPTITTSINGASDLMRPDDGVVLVDPLDVAALAGAMDRFADFSSRSRAAAALRIDRERLSMSRRLDELEAIYERSVDARQ
jgi:UDP-glucose:(heptosyl)LPS alpha-1,3-glucosyltransferase